MVSIRRVVRGFTSSSAVAYARRRRYDRFLASFRIVSPDIIEETLSPANYRQPILVSIRRSAYK